MALSDNLPVGTREFSNLKNVLEFNTNIGSNHPNGEDWQGMGDVRESHQGAFGGFSREVEPQCVIQTNP
jgi:hypothetical protein